MTVILNIQFSPDDSRSQTFPSFLESFLILADFDTSLVSCIHTSLLPHSTMAIGPFTQNELDEIYAFAVDLGRKAGKLLMERVDQRISDANGHSNSFEEKENSVDIVTQTDEGTAQLIRQLSDIIANSFTWQTSKYSSEVLWRPDIRLTS